MMNVTIHTSCGHEMKKPETWSKDLRKLVQASFECSECGSLQIFTAEESEITISSQDFHQYLNKRTEGQWPADGEDTSFVEFPKR